MTFDPAGSTNISASGAIGTVAVPHYRIPAWYSITNKYFWAFTATYPPDFFNEATGKYKTGGISADGAVNVTLSTSAGDTNRVRSYNPTTLHVYTNTILLTFDQREITGIRSTLSALLNVSSLAAAYFIGPTNSGATYDGVSNFPLVCTSAWRTVYTNWSLENTVKTNVNWFTNSIAHVWTNSTVVYNNANKGIFATTNELAWHYSALYRLRDMAMATGVASNRYKYAQGSYSDPTWGGSGIPDGSHCAAGHAAAYANLVANWDSARIYTNDGTSARNVLYISTENGSFDEYYIPAEYSATAEVSEARYAVYGLYTNVACSQNWMVYSHTGQTVHRYLPLWGQAIRWFDYTGQVEDGCWSMWGQDGPASVLSSTSTASLGTLTLPPITDLAISNTTDAVGWYDDNSAVILRWQQRACSNSIFDGRFP